MFWSSKKMTSRSYIDFKPLPTDGLVKAYSSHGNALVGAADLSKSTKMFEFVTSADDKFPDGTVVFRVWSVHNGYLVQSFYISGSFHMGLKPLVAHTNTFYDRSCLADRLQLFDYVGNYDLKKAAELFPEFVL